MSGVIVALAAVAGLVAVSYLIEALRPRPVTPTDPGRRHPVRWTTVNGVRLRYVAAGDGPPLVLLHTLRTQLDMFRRVLPALVRQFRVYALDYPGHGYSDIPTATYSADYFAATVAGFLDQLELDNAVLAGESIGGSIALLLAARRHPRVARVLAINPYDYDAGRGLRRSSALANLIFGLNDVPLLGATVAAAPLPHRESGVPGRRRA